MLSFFFLIHSLFFNSWSSLNSSCSLPSSSFFSLSYASCFSFLSSTFFFFFSVFLLNSSWSSFCLFCWSYWSFSIYWNLRALVGYEGISPSFLMSFLMIGVLLLDLVLSSFVREGVKMFWLGVEDSIFLLLDCVLPSFARDGRVLLYCVFLSNLG